MKVVIASRNKDKIRELQQIFSDNKLDLELLSLDDIGFFDEIEENGSTFEENAVIKASVPASLGYIGIADDSGLSVDALDGAPGVYSARFSGPDSDPEKNNDKLLHLMENVPNDKRTARFVSVIACVLPNEQKPAILSRGECEGTICRKRRGSRGFGYDPLFFDTTYNKTFAELSPEEKNAISHRGRAVKKFCEDFKRKFGNAQ